MAAAVAQALPTTGAEQNQTLSLFGAVNAGSLEYGGVKELLQYFPGDGIEGFPCGWKIMRFNLTKEKLD